MRRYVLALDQGTTSSRAALVDADGRLVGVVHEAFEQIYPRPGWVEHDPEAIWRTQLATAKEVLRRTGVDVREVAAIGVTNQRETTLVWDRATGRTIANAVVWQCRRTSPQCGELRSRGLSERVRSVTGLVIDPYFSATKLMWILDHVPGARTRAEQGDLAAGTVDSWLIWRLTGGRVHATDYTNASRTMLYDIRRLRWDDELLTELDIPRSLLPNVKASSGLFGCTDPELFGEEIPIFGVAGDQQAALFGQACFARGMSKATYGTGAFLLMNTGSEPVESRHGLLTTIAWGLGDEVTYALEGSVFVAGAAVQWLRDELGLIATSGESERLAQEIDDTGGVYVVPAFVGLGAPHWDEAARGTIVGLTRGTGRAHIVRATLEAIAYQGYDVLDAMEKDLGARVTSLRVDGGAAANDFLMQFQADLLRAPVWRPEQAEATVMGAAYLAGLASGVWESQAQIADQRRMDRRFVPTMREDERTRKLAGWRQAVMKASGK